MTQHQSNSVGLQAQNRTNVTQGQFRKKKEISMSVFNTHDSNGTTGISEAPSMFQSPTKKGSSNLEIPAIGNRVRFINNISLMICKIFNTD